ncbi:DUF4974 domain-containing protein [Chitinophaga sp. SYP-B3965]|uniref:FecR family protein n=1 Tax=Chitinophaga sp. SYP-B3965 TaxID=2663120 RepID=UPI001299A865|nr:FecR family protein [Chitinophaga sp. SYP-B3965]MRG44206.1 DUF4974 domain-containing protein [Chitinophaga sp. SYP-B3965]
MKKSFINLIRNYLSGQSTEKEKQFVEEYYDAFDDRADVLAERSIEEKNALADQMKQRIFQKAGLTTATVIIPVYRRTWFKAASVVVLLGTAATFYLLKPSAKKETPVIAKQTPIVPGGKKAILTLADGSSITLDDAQKGKLTMQGHTNIVKQDEGELVYDQQTTTSSITLYNTIRTPRGGEYQVVLPDGSKVWLNAASSLRFPTEFSGKERRVELTGEAYFEVAKNKLSPFIATVNGMEVTVLGTHFNIKAYEDEANIRTTLLEGAVRVTLQEQSVVLAPGQQAAVLSGNKNIKVRQVDVEEQVAWKNGYFHFSGEKIAVVMKQLERWYDLDIVYEGQPTHHFTGTISRNADITKVLKTLEMTGGARFRTEGRKITVLP